MAASTPAESDAFLGTGSREEARTRGSLQHPNPTMGRGKAFKPIRGRPAASAAAMLA